MIVYPKQHKTDMDKIQKIKAEIERRKKALHSTLFNDEYNDLLYFLDTLESEEPVSEDLEEAAKKHSCYDEDCEGAWYEPIVRNAFIAGAKWDREQMMEEAVEGRVSYFESREVAVIYYDDPKGNTMCFFAPSSSLETGDKVRIIILKEDGK